jgi:peroxiredoxin
MPRSCRSGSGSGRLPLFPTLGSVAADIPLVPSVGQAVLHLFCHVPLADGFDEAILRHAVASAQADGYQVVPVALLGHKADLGLMVLGADLWRLRAFQTDVQRSGAVPAASYVSLTEISEYAAGVPEEMRQARLFPQLPPEGKAAFCFYPMSKRRSAAHNWYNLDFESRKDLMMGHGKVGRTFHGRVLQVITGSTGLDEFEWGVTLFGGHPDDLKDCVYQMRFDEASALYAEFGPFYTGMVGELDAVLGALRGNDGGATPSGRST